MRKKQIKVSQSTEQLMLEKTSGNHLLKTHCSKEGQGEKVAWGCIQPGFEYLYVWSLYNLSELPVPVFDHAHIKKVFCYV